MFDIVKRNVSGLDFGEQSAELVAARHPGLTAWISDMLASKMTSFVNAVPIRVVGASAEGWALIMITIKCLKSIRWMPWR